MYDDVLLDRTQSVERLIRDALAGAATAAEVAHAILVLHGSATRNDSNARQELLHEDGRPIAAGLASIECTVRVSQSQGKRAVRKALYVALDELRPMLNAARQRECFV